MSRLDENTWIVESDTGPTTITLPTVSLSDITPDASGKQKTASVIFVGVDKNKRACQVIGNGLGVVTVEPGQRACFVVLSPFEAFRLGKTPVVAGPDEPLFWQHRGTT